MHKGKDTGGTILITASFKPEGSEEEKKAASSPAKQKSIKPSPYSKKDTKSNASLQGVPKENMPPKEYKPEEDKQNIDEDSYS